MFLVDITDAPILDKVIKNWNNYDNPYEDKSIDVD